MNDDIKQITGVVAGLRKQLEETKPKVSETDFKRLYLPLILGEVDPGADVGLEPWRNVCEGNVLRRVDVVDSKGQVLYTVPPLLATSGMTSTDRKPYTDIDTVRYQAIQEAERNPRKASEIISNNIGAAIANPSQNPEDAANWRKILIANNRNPDDYGIKAGPSGESKQAPLYDADDIEEV